MTNTTVADTIIAQMGTTVRMLRLMVAKQIIALENGVQINFGSTLVSAKGDRVQITVDGSDTYTMTFFKYNRRTFECPVVATFEGLYDSMLKSTFQNYTGFNVKL